MATTNYQGTGGGRWEAARRGVENAYTRDSATNAYSRFLGQQRGQRNLADTTKGFERQYPRLAASYGARGLSGGGINSGTMQNSMRRFVGDYYTDFGRQQQDLAQQLQQFDLGQSQLDSWRQSELADIEMQRANEIANAAANLEALRAYLGGI